MKTTSFEPELNQPPKDACNYQPTVLPSTNWAIEGKAALEWYDNRRTWYPRAFVSSISEEQVNSVLLQSIERDKQPPVLIYIYVN